MEHDPKLLQARLTDAAPPDVDFTFRPMFGGIMAYAEAKPFASLSNVGLAIKLFGDDREALLALPGAVPLRYEPDDPPSKTYVVVPEALLADPDAFRPWLIRCIAALPTPRSRKRK